MTENSQEVKKMSLITLVADGSCLGNPGPGGWAALIRTDEGERLISAGVALTTNNRMELTAVLEGLKEIPITSQVHVLTDSRYVIDGFAKGWVKNWKKNGWKTASKGGVKNRDLWEALEDQVNHHMISWEWVKGHNGHVDNERVDAEAQRQAQLAR